MLYVSHPCADIMRKCKRAQFDNFIQLRTRSERLPNTKFRTKSLCAIRDNTTEEDERSYESEVVERDLYNRFQLRCIKEDYLEQLETNHFYRLYWHLNREFIDGLMCVEDVVPDSTDSILSGGLDEHDYRQRLCI